MGKSFIALLAGFTAGAVAGLLLAPKKGSTLRDDILKQSKKWADEGMDIISELTKFANNGNGHNGHEGKKSR
jgi:gas vesicle protein